MEQLDLTLVLGYGVPGWWLTLLYHNTCPVAVVFTSSTAFPQKHYLQTDVLGLIASKIVGCSIFSFVQYKFIE